MQLNPKCKSFLVAGEFGLKLVRLWMLKLLLQVCSKIFKSNSKRKTEWTPKKLLQIPKTRLTRKHLLEATCLTKSRQKQTPNQKCLTLNNNWKSQLKKEFFMKKNWKLMLKRKKLTTLKESVRKKCFLNLTKKRWSTKAKLICIKFNFKLRKSIKPISLLKFKIQHS